MAQFAAEIRRSPAEGLGLVLVVEQLGRTEPQLYLVLGFLTVARRVHEVGDGLTSRGGHRLGLMREVTPDRPGLCLIRVGGPDDLADRGHRILALKHERDDRSTLHELRGRAVDPRSEPLLQIEVMLAGKVRVHLAHFHADYLYRRLLEPLDDTPGQAADD